MKTLVLFIFLGLLTSVGYTQYEYNKPRLQYVGTSSGNRILSAAQKYGMTDSELDYLIKNTDPDLTLKDDVYGATALIHACAKDRDNMVKILLDAQLSKPADIDEVDINGETCLIAASRKGFIKVVRILLDYSANPSIFGKPNKTAHDYAVEFGHMEVSRMLGGALSKEFLLNQLPKQKSWLKT